GTMKAAASKSGKDMDTIKQAQQAVVPAKRFGHPDEFGALCAFLCSRQAGYITGQNMLIDGGMYTGTF
ncbi:MAG TPA: SDR family oxidoreductase, partial [Advenella sp.]|nr:SDR family oxidoreductase [Advenella sp.]